MNRAKLLEQLVEDEGLRLTVYDDATGNPLKQGDTIKGNPTIGIGRELSRHGISRDEAMVLADNDMSKAEALLAKQIACWSRLSDARQRVLANMAFNLGVGGLTEFRRMLMALELGDYEKAAAEMLNSAWSRQVKGRAGKLARMMRTGNDD